MSKNLKKYGKLVNETNKIIRCLSNSVRNINFKEINYLIFHRKGICSAIMDKHITRGEMLIISRFINLVIGSNILEINELTENDVFVLLRSLLKGFFVQHNNYYWTTVFVILSQSSVIEILCQYDEMLVLIHELLQDTSEDIVKLVKSTISILSQFICKLLEFVNSNFNYINAHRLFTILRLSCYSLIHIIEEIGVSSQETKSICELLINISHLNMVNRDILIITNDNLIHLLNKLSTESNLNKIVECSNLIRSILPYTTQNLNNHDVINKLCKISIDILQRTVAAKECVDILGLAGYIIEYSSYNKENIFDYELNIKSLMGFVRILPSTEEHSSARNNLWWTILCRMNIELFQKNYKKYFLPFLENILGSYFDPSSNKYGLSEFNLSNGYWNMYYFAEHIFSNIIECMKTHKSGYNKYETMVKNSNFENLNPDNFCFSKHSYKEFKEYIKDALTKWSIIQKERRQKTQVIQTIKPYNRKMKRKKYDQDNLLNQSGKLGKIIDEFEEFGESTSNDKIRDEENNLDEIPQIEDGKNISTKMSGDSTVTMKSKDIEKIMQTFANSNNAKPKEIDILKENNNDSNISNNANTNAFYQDYDLLRNYNFSSYPDDTYSMKSSSDSSNINNAAELDAENESIKHNLSDTTDEACEVTNQHNYIFRSNPYKHKMKNVDCPKKCIKRKRCKASTTDNLPKESTDNNCFPRKKCNKSEYECKIAKSNVDVSFNVLTDMKKQDKCANPICSKKVELKIRFDLKPIRDLCLKNKCLIDKYCQCKEKRKRCYKKVRKPCCP